MIDVQTTRWIVIIIAVVAFVVGFFTGHAVGR